MNISRLFSKKPKNKVTLQDQEGHLGGYVIDKPAPGTWVPEIWDWLISEHHVQSVLDVGCGLGYTVKYFADNAIDVQGIDGSLSAISNSVAKDHVIRHDYCDGKYEPAQMYDVIWSSEFVEHVDEEFLDNFLHTFKFSAKFLLMTYAVPGQGGYHHVNEQPEEYWVEKIEGIGMKFDKKMTQEARSLISSSNLGHQFKQKGLVFVKGN